MSIERTLFAFGGTMIMIFTLLTIFHHPNWAWVTLFIGFNCFQSAFTGFCPAAIIMRKLGIKSEAQLAVQEQPQ